MCSYMLKCSHLGVFVCLFVCLFVCFSVLSDSSSASRVSNMEREVAELTKNIQLFSNNGTYMYVRTHACTCVRTELNQIIAVQFAMYSCTWFLLKTE